MFSRRLGSPERPSPAINMGAINRISFKVKVIVFACWQENNTILFLSISGKIALVRATLEYGSIVWDPWLQKHIYWQNWENPETGSLLHEARLSIQRSWFSKTALFGGTQERKWFMLDLQNLKWHSLRYPPTKNSNEEQIWRLWSIKFCKQAPKSPWQVLQLTNYQHNHIQELFLPKDNRWVEITDRIFISTSRSI